MPFLWGSQGGAKGDNATKNVPLQWCAFVFSLFCPVFSSEIAAKWKLRTPFVFFHVGARWSSLRCAAVCTCNYVFGAKRVFFGGVGKFSAETRENFNWKLPEILFAFAVLTVWNMLLLFLFEIQKSYRSLRLNFTIEKKADHLISTAKVALTALPFPPSISAQRKSKREKKKRSKMQGNLRRKIAPREVVCSRPFIFSAKKSGEEERESECCCRRFWLFIANSETQRGK